MGRIVEATKPIKRHRRNYWMSYPGDDQLYDHFFDLDKNVDHEDPSRQEEPDSFVLLAKTQVENK